MCSCQEDQADIDRLGTLEALSQFAGRDPSLSASLYSQVSVDCGYFCGVALQVLYHTHGNPLNKSLNRARVYAAREDFLQQRRSLAPGQVVSAHRHDLSRALDPLAAPEYLSFLGLSMYCFRPAGVLGLNRRFRQQVSRLIGVNLTGTPARPSPRQAGIMFARATTGHWFAILHAIRQRSAERWLVYDSSGVRGTTHNAAWLDPADVATRYGSGITHVIFPAAAGLV